MSSKPGHITSERARQLAAMRKTPTGGGLGGGPRKQVRCKLCDAVVDGARALRYEHPKVCPSTKRRGARA